MCFHFLRAGDRPDADDNLEVVFHRSFYVLVEVELAVQSKVSLQKWGKTE